MEGSRSLMSRPAGSRIIAPDGLFEFKGLGRGVYNLLPSVKGYDVRDTGSMELLIEGDVRDLVMLLQPATPIQR